MSNNEFGDFQTPDALAHACVQLIGISNNARIFEPTCGRGSFLKAAKEIAPNSERQGLEINSQYAEEASQYGRVSQGDIFQFSAHDLSWTNQGDLFLIGNPPWVTSADLQRMGSGNIPHKANFKRMSGYQALLGSSNFDVCEYIILKLLSELRSSRFTLAMLCKTQVARNVVEFAYKDNLPITGSAIYRIDAKKWFNALVDACLLVVHSDPQRTPSYVADVYDCVSPAAKQLSRFGIVNGQMISDVDKYMNNVEGDSGSPYEWRSGLKHDAAKVFELNAVDGKAVTSYGDVFVPDHRYILPLLKSTDVHHGRQSSKWVIVPQCSFGSDTESLHRENSEVWDYLNRHGDLIDNRKSSIYRGKPRFTVFGHGDYTYAPYKVAISGLHKSIDFQLLKPISGDPVVLDDTCYFIPFDDPTEACVVYALLSSKGYKDLLESLVFWDSKRPINKKVLSRIDMFRVPFDADLILSAASEKANQLGLTYNAKQAEDLLRHDDSELQLFDA